MGEKKKKVTIDETIANLEKNLNKYNIMVIKIQGALEVLNELRDNQ